MSAPVLLGESVSCGVVLESGVHAGFENTLDNADFTGAGSENEINDAQVVVPGADAENDFLDAQVVVPGSSGAAARYSTLRLVRLEAAAR